GLDPAEYFFRLFPKRAEQFDLFLGKLHSAKGYHWAVEAAKHAGHRLVLAGGWRPSFTGAIKYVGEVDGRKKAALLARARCLWNPAQWDEPFGLVTIEALLSGTPVLGTRRGALPELITPEVGALCDTMEATIAVARRQVDACRVASPSAPSRSYGYGRPDLLHRRHGAGAPRRRTPLRNRARGAARDPRAGSRAPVRGARTGGTAAGLFAYPSRRAGPHLARGYLVGSRRAGSARRLRHRDRGGAHV